jgi:hypothetical protein
VAGEHSGMMGCVAAASDALSSDYPVTSAEDLIAVVSRLRTSLAEGPEDWSNSTLDRYLEAIGAWLTTFPQSYTNLGVEVPDPGWRFVADVLRVGRIYE